MLQPLQGVPKEPADLLATVRIVIAAASTCEAGRKFSIENIAMEVGMTSDTVRAVMNSAPYRDALVGECKNLLSHVLTRGLRRMDDIVHAEKATDSNRVAAFRAIVSTFEAVRQGKTQDNESADLDAFLQNFGKPKIPSAS